MRTKTNVKAGSSFNHNETLRALAIRTHVRAGSKYSGNHNESLSGGFKLKTNVKAGSRR